MRDINRRIHTSVRPGTPLELNHGACIYSAELSERLFAADVARHAWGGDVYDWVGVWRDADTGSRALVDVVDVDVG